jgi:pyruvate dehydrogenase E1 component
MLHPTEKPRVPYVTQCLGNTPGVVVAASDYIKSQPEMIARFIGRPMIALGTDGFGRSEDRQALRNFFEVDARYIALAALAELVRKEQLDRKILQQALKDLQIDPEKANPAIS